MIHPKPTTHEVEHDCHLDGQPVPAPSRYCLAVCYCGDCPHYKPIRRTRDRDDIGDAPAPKTTNSAWSEREDPTWIDKL